jgi:hypothetical protein
VKIGDSGWGWREEEEEKEEELVFLTNSISFCTFLILYHLHTLSRFFFNLPNTASC